MSEHLFDDEPASIVDLLANLDIEALDELLDALLVELAARNDLLWIKDPTRWN